VVVGGTAQVVNGDQELVVRANESTFIPAGNRHRLSNRESEPLVIIEVQTGAYVEEDDIVRLEDVYGRT
jgi:mannose-1-phosphate guanylyltransferase